MPSVNRVRRWWHEHPTSADALLGLGVLVPIMLSFTVTDHRDPFVLELTPATFATAVIGCLGLSWRRRAPRTVWVLVSLVCLTGVALAGGPTPAYVPAIVALYTVGTRAPTWQTIGAAVLSGTIPASVSLAVGEIDLLDAFAYGMAAWSGVAALAGIAVRNQRAAVVAATERARLAETTREEEAQRRVVEERLRIARELHDVVAHHVSVINVQAGVAGHLVRSNPDGAVEAIAHVREASQTVLAEVPLLLGLLRTTEDDLETSPAPRLVDAERLVEQARRSGLRVTWQTTGTPLTLAPGADLTAYRVLQEALTNAARHGTGSALITVAYDAEACTLEVRNDRARRTGADLGAEVEADVGARHGLVGMTERVAAVGGRFSAGPEAGQWVVRARLAAAPA